MLAKNEASRLENFWHNVTAYEFFEWRCTGISITDVIASIKSLEQQNKISGIRIHIVTGRVGLDTSFNIQIVHSRGVFHSLYCDGTISQRDSEAIGQCQIWFSVWGYIQQIFYTALILVFVGMIYRETLYFNTTVELFVVTGTIGIMHLFFHSFRIRDKNYLVKQLHEILKNTGEISG